MVDVWENFQFGEEMEPYLDSVHALLQETMASETGRTVSCVNLRLCNIELCLLFDVFSHQHFFQDIVRICLDYAVNALDFNSLKTEEKDAFIIRTDGQKDGVWNKLISRLKRASHVYNFPSGRYPYYLSKLINDHLNHESR